MNKLIRSHYEKISKALTLLMKTAIMSASCGARKTYITEFLAMFNALDIMSEQDDYLKFATLLYGHLEAAGYNDSVLLEIKDIVENNVLTPLVAKFDYELSPTEDNRMRGKLTEAGNGHFIEGMDSDALKEFYNHWQSEAFKK